MKILVLGTGVIGTIYGWALSEAGFDISHFVRKGKGVNLKEGVALDLLDERKGHQKYNLTRYDLKCVEEISPQDNFELIIIPTNSYQTEGALETLVPQSGEAVFLVMSANWEGTGFIDNLLPRERYVMGYFDAGGTIRNGLYWTNLGGEIHLGELDSHTTGGLTRVKETFIKADIQPDVQENIVHWLWLHNAMSIGIWAGFAKYRETKPFLKDRPLLVECYYSTRELIELCRLRGVDLQKYPEISTFKLPVWLFIILFRWLYAHNESMQRFTAHAAVSLREAKENLDQMMETAVDLGLEMPHTQRVGEYLKDV